MIPVMDWTTGGTLGGKAGEYEGREDAGGGQEISANGTSGRVTGPVHPCARVGRVIRRTPSRSKPLKPAGDLLPPLKKASALTFN